jgi:hypothetical protein
MWRYEARNGGGKPSTAPYVAADPNRHASSKDPCDWCDFETAIAAAKRHGFDGVSFALTPAVATTKPGTFTPTATTWIAAFDLDDCHNPKSGALALWAQGLIEEARSYVEITPSGTGLRIIGYGRADSAVHNKLKAPGGGSCEIYRQTPKFITVTGDALDGWNTDLRTSTRRYTTTGALQHKLPTLMAAKTGRPIIRTARAICRIGIDGIASKYWNRLRQEVDRGFDRSDNAAGEGFGSDGGEGFSEKCADPQDEKLTREARRLAALNAPAYERERLPAAKKLGVRASILDKLVAAERPHDETQPGQGRPIELPDVVPWDEPVNGDALLSELTAAISRYVVLPNGAALVIALWAVHSYVFDCFQCTPRLAITAPTKGCGKTLLLDVIRALVQRAFSIANITSAATFRMVELCQPTLLVDEADSFLPENEELRGILNSGHRCGGQVIRTVGDDHEPRAFSTHAPCAIALIGKLPSTLDDRSVHVEMKRKTTDEKVASFRFGRTPDLDELARKAARWAADNSEALRGCEPKVPKGIENRQADNWEPLLAIADVAGGKWPEAIRKVAVDACGTKEDDSQNIRLLADIRDVIETNWEYNHISSGGLVSALVAMPDREWSECKPWQAAHTELDGQEAQAFQDTVENSSNWGNDGKGLRNSRFQRCIRTLFASTRFNPSHRQK